MTNTFKTHDIVLAAFLRLNQCQLLRIEKEGQRGTFVFDDNTTSGLVEIFDLGQARVEPVAFNNMIKSLTTSVRRMD